MIAIVDYGLGNLFSVHKAFEFLGAHAKITSDPDDIHAADRIVLPGVGAFDHGMVNLKEKGLDKALEDVVRKDKNPFLGICLGLQLLADEGEENGVHPGFGWITGRVTKIKAEASGLKAPHIGWNNVARLRESPLFKGIKPDADFYFVHSYQLHYTDEDDLLATTEYGEIVTAAIMRGNIFATQFHPEKSQEHGLKLLENFINWEPDNG